MCRQWSDRKLKTPTRANQATATQERPRSSEGSTASAMTAVRRKPLMRETNVPAVVRSEVEDSHQSEPGDGYPGEAQKLRRLDRKRDDCSEKEAAYEGDQCAGSGPIGS